MIKDGKLFGKINIIDFGIVVLILALIIAGSVKFKTFDEQIDAGSLNTITYTFYVNNVRDYTAKALMSGDKVFDSATNVYIGTIKNVEVTSAKVEKELLDGKTILAENPYKIDILLTIETPGTVTNTGYFANKSIELKVGSEKTIDTKYATTVGRIRSIVKSEGE